MKSKVTLSKLKLSQAENFAKLANNKMIWLNMRDNFPFPYSVDNAIDFINRVNDSDLSVVYGIFYENKLAGAIGLHLFNDINKFMVELGYWIGEPYWSKGIATVAVEKMVNFGFENLKINRIFASILETNIASQKVLLKNNFTFEGISRKSAYKNGEFLDEHQFGLLKDER
jgi:RimJ/RimL family protein N-acetyltransferase